MLSGVLYLKLCWKSVFRATHFALFIKLLTTERVIRRCHCHGMQVGYHYKYSRMGVSPSISAWPTIADLLLAHISQGVILPRRGGGRGKTCSGWNTMHTCNCQIPSSALWSHSTIFFICSRKTVFPFWEYPPLYHLMMVSSLRTSAKNQGGKDFLKCQL